jgi:hypothetical protein
MAALAMLVLGLGTSLSCDSSNDAGSGAGGMGGAAGASGRGGAAGGATAGASGAAGSVGSGAAGGTGGQLGTGAAGATGVAGTTGAAGSGGFGGAGGLAGGGATTGAGGTGSGGTGGAAGATCPTNPPAGLPSGALTRYSGNPIVRNGPGAIDFQKAGPRAVLKEGPTTYRMWYEAVGSAGITVIGYATSADGLTCRADRAHRRDRRRCVWQQQDGN